jgi:hypothetical protein
MATEQLGTGGVDGNVIPGKVGFYGATPIARPTVTLTTTTATTGSNEATLNAILAAIGPAGLNLVNVAGP